MKWSFTIVCLLLVGPCFCQDSLDGKKTLTISGYVKELAWMRLDKNLDNLAVTNLVHNRINAKWSPSETWTGRIEVRNRFYWGDEVRNEPAFKNQLRNKGEAVNLSANWINGNSTVLHSNIERLWMEYRKPRWNLRAGRQRINWGICNTWNPNDLFNSYNFLDFDFEERPGSDALKVQYMINGISNIETAFVRAEGHGIVAARYSTHIKNYDLQANAGWFNEVFTTGIGWAGSIAEAGFKGEFQYYADQATKLSHLLVSLEGDYVFKNGWYLSAAFLYNQEGISGPILHPADLLFQPSPRFLMPTRWNFLLTSSREFTPLLSGSLNMVYAPGTHLLIIFPTLRYNLKPNWDLDLVWQSYFAETTRFEALSHVGYLRCRWSF